MKEKTMGFIGGGRITRIILEGLKRKGKLPAHVAVSDANPEAIKALKTNFPEISPGERPASQDILFLALHPPAMAAVFEDLKLSLKPETIIVSLAPKIPIARLTAALGGFDRVVRMIPNAPSIINRGYNPVAFSPALSEEERAGLIGIFKSLGDCPEVEEEKLEAYAILAAMGPTYFWFQWDELRRLGESFGLTKKETERGILRMVEGAVKTLFDSDLTAAEVMDLVPAKPITEDEATIRRIYETRLGGTYRKLTTP
jgi:pyrroline-5-carboxylate reductase